MTWTELDKPIIGLSPMADLTDLPLGVLIREVSEDIYSHFGIKLKNINKHNFFGPIIFREMISSNAIVMKNAKTLEMVFLDPIEYPVVQQIIGSDPSVMADAVDIILAKSNPVGIDINMGCPSKKINQTGAGASLLKDINKAREIIIKVKKRTKNIPLSIKIRTGWNNTDNVISFVKDMESFGVDLISVHGRTRSQGYSGRADLNIIKKIKENVKIPVLGNGDVKDVLSAKNMINKTNCDGMLIGRGALGNPWLFAIIDYAFETNKDISISDYVSFSKRIEIVLRHLDLHIDHYGENGYITFKKHIVFYFRGIDLKDLKKVRTDLVTTRSLNEMKSILFNLQNQ